MTDMQPPNGRCSAYLRGSVWRTARCTRKASITRDGKPYCHQHDPEVVKARRLKADDALNKKDQLRLNRLRLAESAPDLLAACEAFVTAHEKSHQLEKTDVAVRKAKAAIAKAKGTP